MGPAHRVRVLVATQRSIENAGAKLGHVGGVVDGCPPRRCHTLGERVTPLSPLATSGGDTRNL